MLDIFNSNAFGVLRLTDVINDVQFKPGRVGELGLFATDSVDTVSIAIEKVGDTLILVPPSQRGAPGTTMGKEKRDLRNLNIPHFEINDAVMAEEVQGVRALGEVSALETVAAKVTRRLQTAVNSFAVTEEFHRMGALTGIVTYADGSTTNLFTEFGVSQLAEVDFDLDNGSPASGALRAACTAITRAMQSAMGGVPFSGIHAFCGDAFFDDLLAHPEVRATYEGWGDAKILREAYIGPNRPSWGIFEFGGIVFENYRGSVGGTDFVHTDKCHMFPTGAADLFKSVYGPADYMETVNTPGQRLYAKQYRMPNDKGVHLDSQHNGLQYCTRPNALIKGKR